MIKAPDHLLTTGDNTPLHGHQKWLLQHLSRRAIAAHGTPETADTLMKIEHGNTAITVLPHPEYGTHLYVGEPEDTNPHLIAVVPPVNPDARIHEPEPRLPVDVAQAHINDLRRSKSQNN